MEFRGDGRGRENLSKMTDQEIRFRESQKIQVRDFERVKACRITLGKCSTYSHDFSFNPQFM